MIAHKHIGGVISCKIVVGKDAVCFIGISVCKVIAGLSIGIGIGSRGVIASIVGWIIENIFAGIVAAIVGVHNLCYYVYIDIASIESILYNAQIIR